MVGQSEGAAASAVRYVAVQSAKRAADASDRLAAAGVSPEQAAAMVDDIRSHARLTVNFHPDRLDRRGLTVAASLVRDGAYRPQSETGLSNGQRWPAAGGERNRWESQLFGGVYDRLVGVRPVYGALDLTRDPHGGSPRFGSSFLVLRRECLDRSTFSVGDSHLGPTDRGTAEHLSPVLAGLVEQCASGDGLGRGLSIERLAELLASPSGQEAAARNLDHYVEAQVHGRVDLLTDVEAIVLDPSFANTETEAALRSASHLFDVAIDWHEGSELDPRKVPDDFRGAEIAELARRTTRPDGLVDAATIGRALAEYPFIEPTLSGDPESSHLQRYKKLWHCCLALGTRAGGGLESELALPVD